MKGIKRLLLVLIMALTIGVVISSDMVRSADVTYNSNRGTRRRLVDMGDNTHAPVRFIGGEEKIEAAANHFDTNVAVSTFYILVDLSDTTNYPHVSTNGIVLRQVTASLRQTGNAWRVLVGVVSDVTASNSIMNGVFELNVPSTLNTALASIHYPFGGADLQVTGTTVAGLLTPDINIPSVTTSTDLDSPAGTTNPEVGDIILWVAEVTDGSTLDWAVGVFYCTE